jgi:DNA (cytosine-5)-methyltransferase 1
MERRVENRPRCLDLFCSAGGTSFGYHQAGFEVWGVDNRPQPHYPWPERFIQAEALEFLTAVRPGEWDLIAASPPCQRYSSATPAAAKTRAPDLVAPVRQLLQVSGTPWVIENVMSAPLENSIMLCGLMFGLRVFRHRLFETSHLILAPPHRSHGDAVVGSDGFVAVHGHGERGYIKAARIGENGMVTVVDGDCFIPQGARIGRDGYVTVVGGGNIGLRDRTAGGLIRRRPEDGVAAWRRAMGISWMTRDELAQAIPPAFTHYVGVAMRAHLG